MKMDQHKRRQCHWLIDQLPSDADAVGVIEILTRRLASLQMPMGSLDWDHEEWLKLVVDFELRSAEETAQPEYSYTEYLDTFATERRAEREGHGEMSTKPKPIVYRLNVRATNEHLERIQSGYRVSPTERRIITGDAHDDYVHTTAINENIGGSLPKRFLIATDDDIDDVIAAYEATGRKLPRSSKAAIDDAKRRAKDLPERT